MKTEQMNSYEILLEEKQTLKHDIILIFKIILGASFISILIILLTLLITFFERREIKN
jgi:hypothetical protein